MAASMSTRGVADPRRRRLLLGLLASSSCSSPPLLPQHRRLHAACRCAGVQTAVLGRGGSGRGGPGKGGPGRGIQAFWRPCGPAGAYTVRYNSSSSTLQTAAATAESLTSEVLVGGGGAGGGDRAVELLAAEGGGGGAAGGGGGGDLAVELLAGGGAGGLPEVTLSELGLGASTPVGLVQNVLESLHLELGLPWWGAILTGTVLVRIFVFPLMVKGQREAAKLNNFAPQLMQLNKNMAEAKNSGNQYEFSKTHAELTSFYKKHKINPLKCFLVPMVQMPIFLSFFIALRKMAELPVPSLETGGALWFPNLAVADPFYILPIASTLSMLAVLELGAETGVDNPNYKAMKNVFRVVPILILPFVVSFPTAVFTYWLTSNVISVLQVSVLRLAKVRRALGIPERVRHAPGAVPAQGFISSIKKNWNDAQEAHRLKEREKFIKHRLDIAAKAPLRQTFTQNPLQQKVTTTTTATTAAAAAAAAAKPGTGGGKGTGGGSRPWQDSLG